ncbi:hypothetical protein M569_11178, partial [Genlisea aurea]
SDGSQSGNRKKRNSSAFSLFNFGERFWSEAVLRSGFDDLEASKPGKLDYINYTASGNIANFLNLLEVHSLYLPVPVNFIFIGFEGKGNKDFKLNAEELERWFTKIDHVFEHTRIPKVGETMAPFYKTSVDREQSHHFPLSSQINYNFSVHAIQMGEKVTAIFEDAILALGRKVDVAGSRDDLKGTWQVDTDIISEIFTSLVEYLQLDNAYNIFVLNPKRDIKMAAYGYRRGLSASEINFLKENKALQTKILQSGRTPNSFLALDKTKKPLYRKHPMAKFSWTITEEADTIEWYNSWLDALKNIEKLYQGKDTTDIVQTKVLQMLNGESDDLTLFLEKSLKSGDFSGFHADCLTDAWIGNQSWAFIDLTAGPFSWGPSVGGEGVRTDKSLPNVENTIGSVQEISEDEAEERLQEAIHEKFSVFSNNDHHPIDVLLAEIDVYELFAFKHCKGRKVKLALCEELDERMLDLKVELQSYEHEQYEGGKHKGKAIEALKRMESWNLFGGSVREDSQNYTVARDTFLSHLGATLWGSLRHVISPSLADGAFHYYEKVSFQLFFITQEKVRHIKQLPLDLKSLTGGLSSVVLPTQKVQFSSDLLPLSEDPALAMAFSVARRAAAVPLLLVNGTYRKTIRSYLDSAILQHQLQKLKEHSSLKG